MEIVQLNKMINAIKNFPKGSTTNNNIEKVYKYIQSLTTDSDDGAEVALDCGVSTLYILQKHWLGDWVDIDSYHTIDAARRYDAEIKRRGEVTTRIIARSERVC